MRLERDHRILGGPRLGHPHILGADGPVQHPRAAPLPPCGSAEARESPETSSQCVRNMSVSESES